MEARIPYRVVALIDSFSSRLSHLVSSRTFPWEEVAHSSFAGLTSGTTERLYTIKAECVRICMEMMKNLKQLFAELLRGTELRKVDFKSDQYRLDDQYSKSKFVKDILCP